MNTDFQKEDFDFLSAARDIEWDGFRNAVILITGATGYIGSYCVRALLHANREMRLGLRVVARVRNRGKAEAMFASEDGNALAYSVGDIRDEVVIEGPIDYILHAASVTSSRTMVERPYDTITTIIEGTERVLRLARDKQVKGMVYVSSMEVYGTPVESYAVSENQLGLIDPLLPRNSYPESKRAAECLCAAAAHQYGIPVRIVRLAQTFGPGILPTENRVFAQFARAVLAGEDIVLMTNGSKANCYCYIADSVLALMMLLTKGASGEAYNVANEQTYCSIREMAERLVAAHPESESKLRFDTASRCASFYPPASKLLLKTEKMRSLGWRPRYGLDEMYARMICGMDKAR